MSNAKREGYDAAKRGEPRNANPYPMDTHDAFVWHDGWCEGVQGPSHKSSARN